MHHNHLTLITGITYFSTDYGLLLNRYDSMFEIVMSLKEKKIPKGLVMIILKSHKVKPELIKAYKKALKENG